MRSSIGCAYLAGDGRRCAIGALMNDDEIRFWGGAAESVTSVVGTRNDLSFLPEDRTGLEVIKFLQTLQDAHDLADAVWSLRSALEEVAENYLLDPGKIELITAWEGTTIDRKEEN